MFAAESSMFAASADSLLVQVQLEYFAVAFAVAERQVIVVRSIAQLQPIAGLAP